MIIFHWQKQLPHMHCPLRKYNGLRVITYRSFNCIEQILIEANNSITWVDMVSYMDWVMDMNKRSIESDNLYEV